MALFKARLLKNDALSGLELFLDAGGRFGAPVEPFRPRMKLLGWLWLHVAAGAALRSRGRALHEVCSSCGDVGLKTLSKTSEYCQEVASECEPAQRSSTNSL